MRLRLALAAFVLSLSACAVTHPRLAAEWEEGAPPPLRAVRLLAPEVEHQVLYFETDRALPAPGGGREESAALARAARAILEERGWRVLEESDPPALAPEEADRLRRALRAAAFAEFEADPSYERERLGGATPDWTPVPGSDAVLFLGGEALSETRRARLRRLVRNYTFNLLQLPIRFLAVFLLPAAPIPNVQIYEESPSRQWMQAALAGAEDGRLLYVNDLASADTLLVEDAVGDSARALLEDLPEAR